MISTAIYKYNYYYNLLFNQKKNNIMKHNKTVETPRQLTLDHIIFMIIANEIIVGSDIKEYDVTPIIVKGVQEDENDDNRLVVKGLREGNIEAFSFKKDHHSPKQKEDEIFLNEDNALKAVRTLIKKSNEKAKQLLETTTGMAEFWENKKSISVNPEEKSKVINISRVTDEDIMLPKEEKNIIVTDD